MIEFVGTLVPALMIAALAGVYVWSRNDGHRARAWDVLRLLLRAPATGALTNASESAEPGDSPEREPEGIRTQNLHG